MKQYLRFKKWVGQKKIQRRLDKFAVAWVILIAVILIGLSYKNILNILGLSTEKGTAIILPTPTTEGSFPIQTLDLSDTSWTYNTFSGSITNNGEKDIFNIKVRLAVSKTRGKWDPEEQVVIIPYEIQSGKTISFSESVTPAKSNDPWWTSNIIDAKYYNGEEVPLLPVPTDTPMPTIKQVYVDPDPIIDCVSSYPNCNGSSIRARRSQCSNITCCQVGNNWSVYSTTEKCTEAQKSTQPQQVTVPQATQKTQGNNFYCWNNAYGYAYYTSSGDQCNSDNRKSTSEKTCYDIQKNINNLCTSACGTKKDQDNAICAWAYTGSNPGVEQNSDKYGECLNGPDGAGEHYGACLEKCTGQYTEDIKKC